MAHIIEFTVLGLELILLFKERRRLLGLLRSISYCGMIALIDESIQFLSDREPEVIDIWGDIFGGILGATIGMFLIMAIGKFAKRRRVE